MFSIRTPVVHLVVASNVSGNVSQIISELMATFVDCANSCSRDSRTVKSEMGERNNIVAAAMVKEYARDTRKLPGNVAWQLEIRDRKNKPPVASKPTGFRGASRRLAGRFLALMAPSIR